MVMFFNCRRKALKAMTSARDIELARDRKSKMLSFDMGFTSY